MHSLNRSAEMKAEYEAHQQCDVDSDFSSLQTPAKTAKKVERRMSFASFGQSRIPGTTTKRAPGTVARRKSMAHGLIGPAGGNSKELELTKQIAGQYQARAKALEREVDGLKKQLQQNDKYAIASIMWGVR